MTVAITSPVLGLAVGATYTGPLEPWLLAEGYARNSATVDGAVGAPRAYADTFAVAPAPTAAAVEGSADAVNIVTGGDLVVEVDGHYRYTVALATADTPAAVVTKVNSAIGSVATASLNALNFRLVSDSTGSLSSVKVISGTGTVLANLFLTAGQFDAGSDGNDNEVDYTGDITADGHNTLDAGGKADGVLEIDDPTVAANREQPWFKAQSLGADWSIANDAANLNDESFPNGDFDFDRGGVDDDAPSNLSLAPASGPAAGGTVVTISGDNLVGVTAVSFGGVAGTALDVSNAAEGSITVTTGARAAGVVDVVLTDASGNATMTGAFTYTA